MAQPQQGGNMDDSLVLWIKMLLFVIGMLCVIGNVSGFFEELYRTNGPTTPLSFREELKCSKSSIFTFLGESLGRKVRVRWLHKVV